MKTAACSLTTWRKHTLRSFATSHRCCRRVPGCPVEYPGRCGVCKSVRSPCSQSTPPARTRTHTHRWLKVRACGSGLKSCFLVCAHSAEVMIHDHVYQVARPAAQLEDTRIIEFSIRARVCVCACGRGGLTHTLEAAHSIQPLAHGSMLMRTRPSTRLGSFS